MSGSGPSFWPNGEFGRGVEDQQQEGQGMEQKFKDIKFSAASLAKIEQVNGIIREFRGKGYSLTLRQLYYQFVAKGLPNNQSEYKRLGDIVSKGRWAGLIDWSAIEDRTRNLEGRTYTTSDPQSMIESAGYGYTEDLWGGGQDRYVEVWIEKEALVGVITRVCSKWRVPYFASRGYNSDSEAYAAAQRFKMMIGLGYRPVIFYLGDHDPSGLQMDDDHFERLGQLSGYAIDFRRLALTKEQIEEYDLPPNMVKDTDSRSAGYEEDHGDGCWELDALDPSIISGLIDQGIRSVIDLDQWEKGLAYEEAVGNKLEADMKALAKNYVFDIGDIGDIGYGKVRDRTIKVQRWDELKADKKQEFEDIRVLLGLKHQPVIRRR
jgi:hypothetical protein